MKSFKPTTPSRRSMSVVDFSVLSGAKPQKRLLERLKKHGGRNNHGRITVRHQGGGAKALYRIIDLKQDKFDVPGIVETIEYDPYRNAFIACVRYADGERRYVIAPQGVVIGRKIITSATAPFDVGNRTVLQRIPVGTFVYNVELFPGRGGQLARAAGVAIEVLANEDGYTHLKLPSGEVRKVLWSCCATIGSVSNPEHNLIVIGKAGRSRHLGIRPTVRGSAMNPRDHPYGGGEGRTQRGTRRPKTKWGKTTGGHKTRRKRNRSNALIVKRRS